MPQYNIGDMFIIPVVKKIGIIISINKTKNKKIKYNIFWQYDSGFTETSQVDSHTIQLWFEYCGISSKNIYLEVPK